MGNRCLTYKKSFIPWSLYFRSCWSVWRKSVEQPLSPRLWPSYHQPINYFHTSISFFMLSNVYFIFIQIWNYGFAVDIYTSSFFQFQDATEGGPARLVRLILLVPARRGPLWVTAPMWLTNDRLKIPPPPLSSASPPPFFSRTKLGPKLYVSMHYHFLTQHNIR